MDKGNGGAGGCRRNGPGVPPAAGLAGDPGAPGGAAGWEALWEEAAEGAARLGDEPLPRDEVARLWCDLRDLETGAQPGVPPGLVDQLASALRAAAGGGQNSEPRSPRPDRLVAGEHAGQHPEDAGERLRWEPAALTAPGLAAATGHRPAGIEPAARRPGVRALAALLWAEARWLPLPFILMQVLLVAIGLVLHLAIARKLGAPPVPGQGAGLVAAAGTGAPREDPLWALLLASADGMALIAPWVGTLVALAAGWPRRRHLWADLESLSPFAPGTRLLARAFVAAALSTMLMLAAGWVQPGAVVAILGDRVVPGPAGGPIWPAGTGSSAWTALTVVLARVAPLWLATSWALWWQVRAGTLAAMTAAAALWGTVTLAGGFLGSWNPLMAGSLPAAALQGIMLVAAALLALNLRVRVFPVSPGPWPP